jgi:hypothetical protein
MADQLMPVKRTAATMADYVRAVVRAWSVVGAGVPLEQSVAVLYGQYMIETGGAACWNWNFGNAKHVKGDGYDYQMLNGVWEGESPAAAAQLIASGQAIADASASHATSVGAGRESVIFMPPHPATWFRAFATADDGMAEHLSLLAKHFAPAWPYVLAGDFVAFATALHDHRYFTASAAAYANGMRAPFEALIASSTYEDLVATMDAELEAQPEDVEHHEAMLWEADSGSGGIIHPFSYAMG